MRQDAPLSLITPELTGWRMSGPGGFRKLDDGSIESFGGSGILWYADATFRDFVLEIDWRITQPEDNSGVFVRIPPLDADIQPAIERGYEIQIDDRGIDPETNAAGSPLHLTGAIYKLAPAVRQLSHPVGQWNEFRITAGRGAIVVELNGVAVSRLDEPAREREGHIGLQNHHAGSRVQFRNLYVTPLDE
ncbi:MAG TPA: DUF1080 domain-containing protein [Steroidobacteraceae bacterium]|nr:DUF1080 domain-containing protein [Steroidobacteraceae bacterium]